MCELVETTTSTPASVGSTQSTETPQDSPSILPKYKVLPQAKNSSRPGPLIIDGRFRYFCTRVLGEEGDKKCFYTCSNRRSTGCKANAQLVDGVGTGDTQYLLFRWLMEDKSLDTSHNHGREDSLEVAKAMQKEMVILQDKNPEMKPDQCRQNIVIKY